MSEQEQRNPMTTTPEQVADSIIESMNDGSTSTSLADECTRERMCGAIAAALRTARFSARRECENELEALGLKVAFQDYGHAEQTFVEALAGHILDDKGVVREWVGNPSITADGFVAGCDADPYYVRGSEIMHVSVLPTRVDDCYVTSEAAEAARGKKE